MLRAPALALVFGYDLLNSRNFSTEYLFSPECATDCSSFWPGDMNGVRLNKVDPMSPFMVIVLTRLASISFRWTAFL